VKIAKIAKIAKLWFLFSPRKNKEKEKQEKEKEKDMRVAKFGLSEFLLESRRSCRDNEMRKL
jgi:hypothetical protein